MKIITKLALGRIKSKKTRSAVICAAIFLTMVLFMTVVSISVNIFSSYGLTMRLAAGTDYHGYLRAAAFTIDTDELRDKMLESDDVKEATITFSAAQYALREDDTPYSTDVIRVIEDEKALGHFYTEITEGTFPKSDSEILLNPMFFPDAEIGEKITIYYVKTYETWAETASAEFTVSGFIDSKADFPTHAFLAYSDTLDETYEFGTIGRGTVYFQFDNTLNITGKYDSLINDTLGAYKQPERESFGALNSAYLEAAAGEGVNIPTIMLIVFSVAVVFLCSFLLIYNIYSIALTQDMQSFGLLNVIGTTHKQLRRMTTIQSLVLFAVTLPAGLAAGYFIGWKMLSPLLFSDLFENDIQFEFSPLIPLFTAILTLFTLLWSANRPLSKLKRLTPIATVDYSPSADLPKWYVRGKNYKKKNTTPNAGRLAGYTISRNRKKTVITALSMSISVILFMLIATLCDYMLEYTYMNMKTTDFIIEPQQYYKITGSNSEYHPVPENAEDKLKSTLDAGFGLTEEYVKAVESLPYTDKVWKIRTAMLVMDTPASVRSELRELKGKVRDWAWRDWYEDELKGKLYITAVGIPDELFCELIDSNVEKIGEGYEDGYIIYDASPTQNLRTIDEEEVYIPFNYFKDGENISLNSGTYRIMANTWGTPMYYLTGTARNSTRDITFYLPESSFIREFGEGLTYALLADAKEDCYDLLYAELESMSETIGIIEDEAAAARYAEVSASQYTFIEEPTGRATASITGKLDSYTEMRERVLSIQTVGYSLAAMIFLIGALNIVNTALSSAAERRREFAMLEAVGMTDRQMMRMLLTESLYSGGVAVLITAGVGFPLIAVIINTAMDAFVSLSWRAGMVMLAVCIAVSVLSGLAVFRITKSAAVVERIKVE